MVRARSRPGPAEPGMALTGPSARVATSRPRVANVSLADLTVMPPPDAHATSLSGVAYYLIRDLIVTLQLKPGTALEERELMAQLALGRTPVREAIRRLASEGLIEIYARRGTVVAPVDVRDLARVSEVRVQLEGLAARLAVERADVADRDAIVQLLADLETGAESQRELIRLDQRVHHCVHHATHNRYLEATLAEYLTLSLRLWFLGLERVQRLDEAVDEHRGLLTAVLDRDPDAAEQAARAHVTGFWDEIRQVLAT
ncbi:GntR family transcriptional regulator [Paramicrobacterium chengjingii]|uniref:GntR family transcriptional regulator n=1 Tax=Paramicrobacterium chengjingii TaxID=2769067 RepID=A0ABX6YIZ3_9MICO|nr:GntR family transcriptional regulator [Microbacterium chengjingii]QPZ38767.1 GntR family transcriptional regulator [Microbacterium chengjingii]